MWNPLKLLTAALSIFSGSAAAPLSTSRGKTLVTVSLEENEIDNFKENFEPSLAAENFFLATNHQNIGDIIKHLERDNFDQLVSQSHGRKVNSGSPIICLSEKNCFKITDIIEAVNKSPFINIRKFHFAACFIGSNFHDKTYLNNLNNSLKNGQVLYLHGDEYTGLYNYLEGRLQNIVNNDRYRIIDALIDSGESLIVATKVDNKLKTYKPKMFGRGDEGSILDEQVWSAENYQKHLIKIAKESHNFEQDHALVDGDKSFAVEKLTNEELTASMGKAFVMLLTKLSDNKEYKRIKNILSNNPEAFNFRGQKNITALMIASSEDNEEITKLLLERNSDNLNFQNKNGRTALMVASDKGCTKNAKLLLERNANPDLQDESGWTALMVASDKGYEAIAKLLLEGKANPDLQNKDGFTALMLASNKGYEAIAKLLIERKANPDLQDEGGWTALMLASNKGHEKIVKLLIEEKANPDLQNKYSWTALIAASRGSRKEIIGLLLEGKANPNLQDMDGWTPLMFASDINNEVITKLLLKNNANSDLQNRNGWTPLMFASDKGHEKIAKLLLEEKANPDLQNKNGCTALILASNKGHEKITKLLLEKNANPNLQDRDGWTALMYSGALGHNKIFKTLLEKGSDVKIRNKRQQNAGEVVLSARNVDAVKIIKNHLDEEARNKKESPQPKISASTISAVKERSNSRGEEL